jgi:hypothetical protein
MTTLHGPAAEPVSIFDGPEALAALYRERAHLVAHLAAYYPSTAGYTDPKAMDWLVVTVQLPDGQATWHINKGDIDLFEHVVRHDVPWDGHTTAEKYERVEKATDRLVERRALNEEGW